MQDKFGRVVWSVLLAVAMLVVLGLAAQKARSGGADTHVFVTIQRIRQIDAPDPFGGRGDYYVKVTIAGQTFDSKAQHQDDRSDISPNWQFEKAVAAGSSVAIRIEVWDHDVDSDDQCDVNPSGGKRRLDLSFVEDFCLIWHE